MTEVDRIKYALVNVSTLAKTSDYYNPDRDSSDIGLNMWISKKEYKILKENAEKNIDVRVTND